MSSDNDFFQQASASDCRSLLDNLPDALILLRGQRVSYVNSALTGLLRLDAPQELIGRNLQDLFEKTSRSDTIRALHQLRERQTVTFSARTARINGRGVSRLVECGMVRSEFRRESVVICRLYDIHGSKSCEQAFQQQVNRDALTGLPNRALFYDRLEQELIRAQRIHTHVVLMFIDLDRFKWVNDTLGHAAGDELLREVSRRISDSVRQSDTLARLGGDEFTVILPDMTKGMGAERATKKILDELERPFLLSGQEVEISGSIGIAVFPDDARYLDDLVKNADTAMYRAKADGRGTYRFFTQDMHAEVMQRIALEKDLSRALERRELVIHYQPIIDIASNRLVGAESFLRWRHGDAGLLAPALFLEVAEEIGLGAAFTEWVLEQVCRQGKMWGAVPGLENITLTINLSCSRCRHILSDQYLGRILRDTGLPAYRLILEITENILTDDESKTLMHLDLLKDLGIGLWLDDFGTGYSSLSMLNRLPLDGVKIDQLFISNLMSDQEDAILVEAMMSLVSNLHLQVIAEGVETAEQKQFLLERGCRLAQGYFFESPMSAEDFQKWAEDFAGH